MTLDFSKEIMKILQEYGDAVVDIVAEEAEAAGKRTAKKLKDVSPRGDSEKHYADGWTSKKIGRSVTVYNSRKPGLAHLLEHGYQGRNGFVSGQTHIAPVEEAENDEFYNSVVRRLR